MRSWRSGSSCAQGTAGSYQSGASGSASISRSAISSDVSAELRVWSELLVAQAPVELEAVVAAPSLGSFKSLPRFNHLLFFCLALNLLYVKERASEMIFVDDADLPGDLA
jgi:hypothetical protein